MSIVVVKLMHGLGNQMFQYAAGRALSLQYQVPLRINIDSFTSRSFRQYEISKYFHADPDIATDEEMSLFNLNHPVRQVWNKVFRGSKLKALPYEEDNTAARTLYQLSYCIRPPHSARVYEEKQFHFDNNFFKASPPVFLKGYWQSYKYFHHYYAAIKQDFTVKEELIAHLKPVAKEIKNSNSIALHIRCTDKATPGQVALFGKLSVDYYKKGVDTILKKRGDDVRLYVFTDDTAEARNHIPPGFDTTVISDNISRNAVEDFYLMSQCKDMVIANSSFSWWSAYLNDNKNCIIIAPEKWFNRPGFNDKDVYPPHWIKM